MDIADIEKKYIRCFMVILDTCVTAAKLRKWYLISHKCFHNTGKRENNETVEIGSVTTIQIWYILFPRHGFPLAMRRDNALMASYLV